MVKEEYITMLVPKKYRDATLILGATKDLGANTIKVPKRRYHDFTKLGFKKLKTENKKEAIEEEK